MRALGRLLLWLGLLVGGIGSVGLMLGLHSSGLTWLVTIGLAKLTLVTSGGLMAGGATLQRLARRDADRKALGSPRRSVDTSTDS